MKQKLLVVLLSTIIFCSAISVSAMTEAERQSLISQLQIQIANLITQLTQLQAEQQGTDLWCYTFNHNLGYANSGTEEISYLHTALTKQGISYSPDSISTYSTGTSQAIIKFQKKYGIAQSGYVGTKTRAKLNQLYKCNASDIQITSTEDIVEVEDSIEIVDLTDDTTDCTPSWTCGSFGTCSDGWKTRTCTDKNNCGIAASTAVTSTRCVSIFTACSPSWTCGEWSSCVNGKQTRNCTDKNICGALTNRPALTQTCVNASCVPDWSCDNWSACSNSNQTRVCTDKNKCGVLTNKPAVSQSCISVPTVDVRVTLATPGVEVDYNGKQTKSPVEIQNCNTSCVSKCSASTLCGALDGCGGTCQEGTCSGYNVCEYGICVYNHPTGFGYSCTKWSDCAGGKQYRTCWNPRYDFVVGDVNGPATVYENSAIGIKWNSKNARYCTASGDWSGTKLTSGLETVYTSSVSPKTYTYNLSCTGPDGTSQDSVIVNVNKPITTDITANKSVVNSGDNFVLTWNSTGVTSCNGVGDWSGIKATSGTETIGPLYASEGGDTYKKYTISCGGSQDSITVIVRNYGLKISAYGSDPRYSNIKSGEKATITWSSTGATSCTASGDWSGTKATSGTETIGPIINSAGTTIYKSYDITCDGPLGESYTSASITVAPPATTSLLDQISNQLASLSNAILNFLAK